MEQPRIVSRDEWLAARKALLAREKAHTREGDALSADRRRLPMVKVERRLTCSTLPTGAARWPIRSKAEVSSSCITS